MKIWPLFLLFLGLSLGCALEVDGVGPGEGGLDGDELVEAAGADAGTDDATLGSDDTTPGTDGTAHTGLDTGDTALSADDGSLLTGAPDGGEPVVDAPLVVAVEQCSPETETLECPGTSCDPATKQCSTYKIASRPTCWTCVSDSDCEEPNHRCVEMYFLGERFPDAKTGFCLPIAVTELGSNKHYCDKPLASVLMDRRSLSGGKLQTYCGPQEKLTTCFAIRAFENQEECPSGQDDECPVGSVCRTFEEGRRQVSCCTFECTSSDECPAIDGLDQTCGGYCGA
jgi:hypothetical protein